MDNTGGSTRRRRHGPIDHVETQGLTRCVVTLRNTSPVPRRVLSADIQGLLAGRGSRRFPALLLPGRSMTVEFVYPAAGPDEASELIGSFELSCRSWGRVRRRRVALPSPIVVAR